MQGLRGSRRDGWLGGVGGMVQEAEGELLHRPSRLHRRDREPETRKQADGLTWACSRMASNQRLGWLCST